MVRCVTIACWLVLLSAAATPARTGQMDHASYSGAPVPGEILDRPVALRSGIGIVHQKVSTPSVKAQAFYDQGLAYLHSYVWIEAARSFHQALRNDPHLAMAYVGLADAYLGLQDVLGAQHACDSARTLGKYMSAEERAWLEIRQREIDSLDDLGDKDKLAAYRNAVDRAIAENPRDAWLRVQRGLAEESSPFTHGQVSGPGGLAYYKEALELDPRNLAARHYSIHVQENVGHIQEALEESTDYVHSAPAIPHAHHMHGHELMRMGRTEEAIREFVAAKNLEENYFRLEKIPPQYDWQYAHNLELLALNYQLLGRVKAAEALLRQAFNLPASTEFLDYNRRVWLEFLINRRRFTEALEAARELASSRSLMAQLAGHTLAGEALLGLNRVDDAKRELALAEQDADNLPPRMITALPYPAALRGVILLRENQIQEGESLIVEVEKSMIAMPGPDAWISALFSLESIAREARSLGDWDLARFTAEQMIRHDPYYAGGHFAIGLVAEHAGESAGSRPMFAQAARLWAHADPDLPELALARRKLESTR